MNVAQTIKCVISRSWNDWRNEQTDEPEHDYSGSIVFRTQIWNQGRTQEEDSAEFIQRDTRKELLWLLFILLLSVTQTSIYTNEKHPTWRYENAFQQDKPQEICSGQTLPTRDPSEKIDLGDFYF